MGRSAREVRGLSLREHDRLDEALIIYLDKLFHEGETHSIAKAVVFGVAFKRGLSKSRSTLPRARRALGGFAKSHPGESRDPIPEEAVYLMIDDMLKIDAQDARGNLIALCTATTMSLQWDLAGRASETIGLTKDRVVEPQERKYPRYAVIFHPKPTALRKRGGKPSKSGTFDDTIFSGADGKSNNIHTKILKVLREQACPGESLVAPMTLAQYEREVAECTRRLEIQALGITPHSFRHGAASHALQKKYVNLKSLAERLRVLHLATVRRYGRSGSLRRQVKLLGATKRRHGEGLVAADAAPNNPMLELLARLKGLRRRRHDCGL